MSKRTDSPTSEQQSKKTKLTPYEELNHEAQVERLITTYKNAESHPSIYNEKLNFKTLKDGKMQFTLHEQPKSQIHLVGKVTFTTGIYGDYQPPKKLEFGEKENNLTAEQIAVRQQEHARISNEFKTLGLYDEKIKYPAKFLWSARQKFALQLEPSQVSMLNDLLNLAFAQIAESGQQKVSGVKLVDEMLYLEAPLIGPETEAGLRLKKDYDPLNIYPEKKCPHIIPVNSRKPYQTKDGPQREFNLDMELKGDLVVACVTLDTYISKTGELGYKPRVHSFMLATPGFSGFSTNYTEDEFPELC